MTSPGTCRCTCLILIEAALGVWMSVGGIESEPGQQKFRNNMRSIYESATIVESCPDQCACWIEGSSDNNRPDRSYVVPTFHVDCSNRNLLEFPARLPNETQVLNMSNNHLQNLTSLPPLPKLRVLDLSFNWLRHLDNKWVFEHSPELRILRLSNNALRSIQHGSFSGLSRLETLDLSGNILRTLDTHALGGLHRLKVLRLDRNQLFHLTREWFMALTSLNELHMSHNRVAVLDDCILDRLVHLQHLDLSHNSLQVIHDGAFTGLANLRLLNLSGNNRLTSIHNKALNSISNLDILLLDETTLPRLESLSFSGLAIAEISLSYCTKLRVLEKYSVYNMSRLITLQIHDNPKLIFIHPSAFSSLPSLKHLLLHNNGLIAVPGQITQLVPSIVELHLYHNPFHCDCNSFWLRHELNKRPGQHHHRNNALSTVTFNSSSGSSISSFNQNNKQNVNKPMSNNATSSSSSTVEKVSTSTVPSIYDYPRHSNNTTSTLNHGDVTTATTLKSFVTEPDRVACFFPTSLQTSPSSVPMIQLPLQYFAPTCPPSALPLFPSTLNVTLGEDLVLECQGLGIPSPQISWILPGGREISSSVHTTPSDNVDASLSFRRPPGPQIVDETLLRVTAVRLTDSGMYGCKVANSLGQDFSSVLVYVVNKPLELIGVKVGNDFITVSWRGSIPRRQMADFQLFYRDTGMVSQHEFHPWSSEDDIETDNGLDLHADYKVIRLHGSVHKCTITDLKPHTKYQICIVYKKTHLVTCREWTTLRTMQMVRASQGIVKVNRTQIVVAIASVLGVLLVSVLVVTIVRRRHRRDYNGPGNVDEKVNIPLEGLLPTTPSPCLTSSRTALLSNSHV